MTRLNDVHAYTDIAIQSHTHTNTFILKFYVSHPKQSTIYELYLINSVCKFACQLKLFTRCCLSYHFPSHIYSHDVTNKVQTTNTNVTSWQMWPPSRRNRNIVKKCFLLWTYLSFEYSKSTIMCTLMFVACW